MPLIRPRALLTVIAAGTVALIGASGLAQAQASGAFAAPPNFGTGTQAAAVFLGGSVDQLETAARGAGANGVWAQDSGGRFQLLVVGGPSFLRDAFAAPFPGGFAASTAVTLTRTPGATPPPAIVTSTPTAPRPTTPGASPGAIPGPSTND
jgi:hypothetical protein